MKILIKSYEDLFAFVNREDINVSQAYEATIAYIEPIIVFSDDNGYTSKAELLADLENYIEIEKISVVPPLFLKQKDADFNIRDIYNS